LPAWLLCAGIAKFTWSPYDLCVSYTTYNIFLFLSFQDHFSCSSCCCNFFFCTPHKQILLSVSKHVSISLLFDN